METLATATLVGLGIVVVLHSFNGGAPVVKAWLNYVFTGRGAHVDDPRTSSSSSSTGSLLRV